MPLANRCYKPIAWIVALSLILSSFPPRLHAVANTLPIHAAAKSNAPPPSKTFSSLFPTAMVPQLSPPALALDALNVTDNMSEPPPLVIAKAQSAWTAVSALSNTLVVTFTVINNQAPLLTPDVNPTGTFTDTINAVLAVDFADDPHTLNNVILSDSLLPVPDAAFVAASHPADQDGTTYSWSLGDIPPLSSTDLVVTLTVPSTLLDTTLLDTGAHAYGSLAGEMITGQASPITLAADSFDNDLVCTIDANCNDEYVLRQVAQLGGDPTAIFNYVRGLGFESYQGSLRGARGTLWSQAGNAVDQASLLIALLRASGIPATYRNGTLSQPRRQELIQAMFSPVTGVLGFVPEGTLTAQPTLDGQLLDETAVHWWVEAYLPTLGWTPLDPTFASANIGDTFADTIDPTPLAELPDSLRHKVTVKLKVENYHPLNIGGPIPGLDVDYPLDVTFAAVQLIGETVSLGHFVESDALGGLIFSTIQHTYVPYLIVGQEANVIEGDSYQEILTNFPLGTFLITGEWLIFDLIYPDGTVETYERELFDLIGFGARQGGGVVSFSSQERGNEPIINEQSVYTSLFAPSAIVPEAINANYQDMTTAVPRANAALAAVDTLIAAGGPDEDDLPQLRAAQQELNFATRVGQRVHLLTYAAASDVGLVRLGQLYQIKPYYDAPRILTVAYERDSAADLNTIQFDLRRNQVRAVAPEGQTWTALQAFNFSRGILDATLEGQLMDDFFGGPVLSVHHIFQAARAQGIESTIITPVELDKLAALAISDEAKGRITASLQDPGKIVVVPQQMVTVADRQTIGWYLIDVISGETVDVMEDGQHTALIEYAGLLVGDFRDWAFAIIGFGQGFAVYTLSFLGNLLGRLPTSPGGLKAAWDAAKAEAKQQVADIIQLISLPVELVGGCFESTALETPLGWIGAYAGGAGFEATFSLDLGEVSDTLDDIDDAIDIPPYLECVDFTAIPIPGDDSTCETGVNIGDIGGVNVSCDFEDIDDWSITIEAKFGGFDNGANFAIGVIDKNIDPPVPSARFSLAPTTLPEPVVVSEPVTAVATLTGTTVTADLTTPHITISGLLFGTHTTAATTSHAFTTLTTGNAALLTNNGTLLAAGTIAVVPQKGMALAQINSNGVTATTTSSHSDLAFYASALNGLAAGAEWPDYALQLDAGQPYSLTLKNSVVTVNDTAVYTGAFTLVTTNTVTLGGAGLTNTPNFAASTSLQLNQGNVTVAPADGNFQIDSQPIASSNGFALADYSGTLTITEATSATDQLLLAGTADFFALTTTPATSTTPPNTPAPFAATFAATFNDTYTLTASAPANWRVQLGSSGQLTVTAPIGTPPADYNVHLQAQSHLHPTLLATAVHPITITPVQGMTLAVEPDPQYTVALGPPLPNTDAGSTNNGQLQLPDAAFIINLTNTSTVSHTFAVQVTGIPTNWLIFDSSSGQSNSTITLPAGGVGQLGLYLSPTLPLPPAGTLYPFTVSAADTDGAGLFQSEAVDFTIPALPYNFLAVAPPLIYAAPNSVADLRILLGNVGNATGSFPVTVTTPLSWTTGIVQSPITLAPDTVQTQTVTITVPADVVIGATYLLQVSSPAPATAYTQRDGATVEIVTVNALALHQASDAIAVDAPDLAAALETLAQAISDLEASCQDGDCSLPLRDRVVETLTVVNDLAEAVSPLLTVLPILEQITAVLPTHTTPPELITDITNITDAIATLVTEVQAVAAHNLTAQFLPGTAVILDDGNSAIYTLRLTNDGRLTTTAVVTLTPPAGTTAHLATNLALLSPGQTLSIPTIITPTAQGLYTFQAAVTAAESTLIQRQATASLNVVDAFVRVLAVTATPDFVETGVSSTTLSVNIANIANLLRPAIAHTTIYSAAGSVVYTNTTPVTILPDAPRTYELTTIDTSGWGRGLYTITIALHDGANALIPDGAGIGFLSVGTAVKANSFVQPAIVPPGDATVTTLIDTERTDTLSDTVDSLIITAPTVTNPGSPFAVTITLLDKNGFVTSDFDGIVQLSSSDGSSNLPQRHRFIPQTDQGSYTFTGIVMGTAGAQTITADSGFFNDSVNITVNDSVVITQTVTWDIDQINITSLTVLEPATLFLNANTTIAADTITVAANAAISADGLGYAANNGPGTPSARPNGGVAAAGAAHGGYGGRTAGHNDNGTPYGSPFQPAVMGSGGRNGDGVGGAGGGAIHLIANTLTIDGLLSANGLAGSAASLDGAGGGAGGSLWLEANSFAGNGTLRTNGGGGGNTCCDDGGGGSGGRIAVHAPTNSFGGLYQAQGGFGYQYGGPGTVYVTDGVTAGTLRVANGGNGQQTAVLLAGDYQFDTIQLANEGNLTVLDSTSMVTLTNNNIGGDGTGRLIIPGSIVAPTNFIINGLSLAVQGQLLGPQVITTTGSGGLELYASTPWANGFYSYDRLYIDNNTSLILRPFVSNNGNNSDDFGLALQLNDLTVATGGTVTANGLGYAAGNGPGAPPPRPNSGVAAVGAAHGGYAGRTAGHNSNGTPYGTPFQPTDLGSGGANGDGGGGAGGGAIHIMATTITLDGILSANGNSGSAASLDGAGGGAGGSLWLQTDTFAGVGTVRANGGNGGNTCCDDGGGGAGGRIAIEASNNSYVGNYQAYGGSGYQFGGPGTIYLTDGTNAGVLQANNNGNGSQTAVLLAGDYEFDTIQLINEGNLTILDTTSVVTLTNNNIGGDGTGRLIVPGTIVAPPEFTINGLSLAVQGQLVGPQVITTTTSGGLELYASTPWATGSYSYDRVYVGSGTTMVLRPFVTNNGNHADDFGLELQLNDLTVEAGGTVTADGLGYAAANGPGTPTPRPNGGVAAAGAAHGGFSGRSAGHINSRLPYGTPFQPTALGSGGANGDGGGGAGGGAIHIIADTLTIDGLLSANGFGGSAASLDGAGGGSGGSLWLEANSFTGTGTLRANGGSGGNTCCDDGGGGSGGRIAIDAATNTFAGVYQAQGGSGYQVGGPGTSYFTDGGNLGTLQVDNGGNNSQSAALLAGNYLFDTIELNSRGHLTILDATSVVTLTNNNISGDGSSRLIVPGTIIAPSDFTIMGLNLAVQGQLVGPQVITTTGSGGLELYASTPWIDGIYRYDQMYVDSNTTLLLRPFVTNNGDHSDDFGLSLQLDELTVANGGTVSADGLGYAGGSGPGTPTPRPNGGVAAAGAAHGGYGGRSAGHTNVGTPYDSPYQPAMLGSGGAIGDGGGGAGGGAIHLLVTNTLRLDGLLTANGNGGSAASLDGAGGGAGGAVWVEAGTLIGSGLLRANGGNGGNTCCDDGGGGAGGRIAVIAPSNNYTGTYQARGGWGYQYGGPGTIYASDGSSLGNLQVDNGGNVGQTAVLLAGDYQFDTIQLNNQGDLTLLATTSVVTLTNDNIGGDGTGQLFVPGTIVAPHDFTIDGVNVVVRGRLSGPQVITTTGSGGLELTANTPWTSGLYQYERLHVDNNTRLILRPFVSNNGNNSDDFGLELRAEQLTVAAGGTVSSNGLGYAGANGPGTPAPRSGSGSAAAGAGHGGVGGQGANNVNGVGAVYGDATRPLQAGSGGGTGDGGGGAGGGNVHLFIADRLRVDGTLTANGNNGAAASLDGAGGGSGGAIWIETPSLTGNGLIRANGGNGGNTCCDDGGGGGGGRVAVQATNNSFTGTITVNGGSGAQAGGVGTIYTDTFAAVPATLTAVPATIIADGITSTALTLTLPLANSVVVWSVSPATGVHLNGQVAGNYTITSTTNGVGVATAVLTSTTTGEKVVTVRLLSGSSLTVTAVIQAVPGAVDGIASTLVTDKSDVVADGSDEALLTATLFDSFGHPVPDKIVSWQTTGSGVTLTPLSSTTDDQGQAQATLRSATVQTVTVTAIDQSDSLTLTQTVDLNFVLGRVDVANSTITVAPTTALANGVESVVVTATLRDSLNRPLMGRLVELQVSGSGNIVLPSSQLTADSNGVAIFSLSSTVVEVKQLSLRDVVYDVTLPLGGVQFVTGAADATASQLTTTQTNVVADGVDRATLVATLTDAFGHPLPGRDVVIQATGVDLVLTQVVTQTDAQGEVQATLQSTTVQSVTVTAVNQSDGFAFDQSVVLNFVVGVATVANSSITVGPNIVVADGTAVATVNATLRDSGGHLLVNRPVELLVTGNENNITPTAQTMTDSAGNVAWMVASTWAQGKEFTIRDDDYGVTIPVDVVQFQSRQSSGIIRYEEYDPAWVYDEPTAWERTAVTRLSGGYGQRAEATGDSVGFTFNGGWLNVGLLTCAACGQAEIFIDGVSQGVVDTYSVTDDVLGLTYAGLVTGSHTFTLTVLGQRRFGSGGDWVTLDYIDVWDGTALPTGSFEQESSRVYYSNDWRVMTAVEASNGRYVSGGSNGWFHFTGDTLTFQGLTFNGAGWVELLIDNVSEGIFNLNAATTASRDISFDNLGSGPHLLQVKAYQGTATVDGFVLPGTPPFHQTYSVDLNPAMQTGVGEAGSRVAYTFNIANTGSKADTYSLTLANNFWPTTLPSTIGPLAPGHSQNVTVLVDIPLGVTEGVSDTVVITAASVSNPMVSSVTTMTTYAVVVDVQLCFTLDGSGSIDGNEFGLMINGLANAMRDPLAVPADGTVEVSVSQFAGSGSRTELAPTVIVDALTREAVASQIEHISQLGGGTPTFAGIDNCAALITGSDNFISADKQVINAVTDGEPTAGSPDGPTAAVNSRNAAVAAGIDALNAEAIGVTTNGITFLRDQLVYPQPGYEAPPFVGTQAGFVIVVDDFDAFADSIKQKVAFVVQTGYGVNVTHTLPITAVSLLTNTIAPPASAIRSTGQARDVAWAYQLSVDQPLRRLQLQMLLPTMQPGEVRLVAEGTTIEYSLPSGRNLVRLSPLYVAASHLISITPVTQTAALGGTTFYDVRLDNPSQLPLTLTLMTVGLPASWYTLPSVVVVPAAGSLRVPLAVTPEGDTGLYEFGVTAVTPTGGQDQAVATVMVTEPTVALQLSPDVETVTVGEMVSYTVIVSNLETVTRTYTLSYNGLTGNDVTLPTTVTVAANSGVTVPLAITAYTGPGPHPFTVKATAIAVNAAATDGAILVVVNDAQVSTQLVPDTAVTGPGVALLYTLTVTNIGTVADLYQFNVDLPVGWSSQLLVNGTPVSTLSLTPFIFNRADLWLVVTPPITAVAGMVPFTVTVQSEANITVQAVVYGTVVVVEQGVQIDIAPDNSTLAPADTGVWQVTVTNTGALADNFELTAAGIVAGSGQFSQNSVALAPGQAQTVQLTADQLDFALRQSYPVEATAVSQGNGVIQAHDTVSVTFTGQEAVSVAWRPTVRTVTDTLTANFTLLVTNTGNVSTRYDLTVLAAALQVETEFDELYIPPHQMAGSLVTVTASADGTYTMTGEAATSMVAASDIATLIVNTLAASPEAADDAAVMLPNRTVTVTVLANDSDPNGDLLTVTTIGQPFTGTVVLLPDGRVTYTPPLGFVGVVSFTYTVSDGSADDTAQVTILVADRVQINYQRPESETPPGFWADDGSAYGLRGNGYSYGWIDPVTGEPADNRANARDRDWWIHPPDQRYDTLNHMQTYGNYHWEMAVPDGWYLVYVVAGDPEWTNGTYRLDVEGVLTVDGQPTVGQYWIGGASIVEVTDGRLTLGNNLTATGNNKAAYIAVTPLGTTPPSGFVADINFQPDGTAVPSGYVADTGAIFGDRDNGYSYGWDVDVADRARERAMLNIALDERYDTLIQMQFGPDVTWEVEVPNGIYVVHLYNGDPQYYIDHVYQTAVEGVIVNNGPTVPSNRLRSVVETVVVAVNDGRLTVTPGVGAAKNKVQFMEVVQIGGN